MENKVITPFSLSKRGITRCYHMLHMGNNQPYLQPCIFSETEGGKQTCSLFVERSEIEFFFHRAFAKDIPCTYLGPGGKKSFVERLIA